MRKALALLLLLVLLPSAVIAEEEIVIWTTSAALRSSYEALSQRWNELNPDQKILLTVEVYSRERITSKLMRAFAHGVRFDEDALPSLADIDLLAFPDYFFEQTTDLHPLQNLLRSGRPEQSRSIGEELYTHNGICFALPYAHGDLVLCYRRSLTEELPSFAEKAASFEGLAELASQWHAQTGQALLSVDYLGGECVTALSAQSGDYDKAVLWLKEMHGKGFSQPLDPGSAYGEPFMKLMEEGKPACVITTVSNLLLLARDCPALSEQYGVLPLPSFGGISRRVCLPATATAVINTRSRTTTARQFLSFCRFSEEAKADPLLYTGVDGTEADTLLKAHYELLQPVCQTEDHFFENPSEVIAHIRSHPKDILQ